MIWRDCNMKNILTDEAWDISKVETVDDASSIGVGNDWWVTNSPKGALFYIQDKTKSKKYLYQPKENLVIDEDTNEKVTDESVKNELKSKLKEIKNQTTPATETPAPAQDIPKAVEAIPEPAKPTTESLDDIYQNILAEKKKKSQFYDITASSHKTVGKSTPRGDLVTGLEQEFFGIDPELIQKLPTQSVELFHQALIHLLSVAKDDPRLMQALRTMIRNQVKSAEKQVMGDETEEQKNESIVTSFKDTMNEIITEAKAMRFNYKILLDIDPNKINDPQFIALLNSFDLLGLSRMQKQGVLLLLKKLAEIADVNPQIALALTRIVRIESAKKEPVQEAIDKIFIDSVLLEAGIISAIDATEQKEFLPWFNAEISKYLTPEQIKTITPTGRFLLNTGDKADVTQIKRLYDAMSLAKKKDLAVTIKNKYPTISKAIGAYINSKK